VDQQHTPHSGLVMELKPIEMSRDKPHRTRIRAIAGLIVTLLFSSCAVGPDFTRPSAPTDRDYVLQSSSPSDSSFGAKQQVQLGKTLPNDWWTAFRSPELNHVVEQALDNNWSLDMARRNLAKAQEAVSVARGGLFPKLDAVTGVGRQKYGATFLGTEVAAFPIFSAYDAGAAVSYDFDVFGEERRQIELAAASARVQEELLNAAHLSVAGDTVLEALQIASIEAKIATVEDVISSDEQNVALVTQACTAGVATQIDLTSAQSQRDRDRTMLPELRQQLDVAQDALAILVGKSPATWAARDFNLHALTLPSEIPMALPSELVRTRPDIRAAEARLHAASAETGIATADLYPHLTLSAGIAENGLFSGPAGAAWSVIGGLTAPIFHGGALTAHRREMQEGYQATFAHYQQTVLEAFRQVADNLHGLSNAEEEVRTEQQALDSADAAVRLTRLGYSVGNAGIIQVLDAQRLQQLAELQLVDARTKQYVLTVTLFLAAGGGISASQDEGTKSPLQ
jgi:NodT family efflux transporter outer membrane factor (OMF) lipoprotein